MYAAEAKERQREAGKRGKEGGRGRKKTLTQKVGEAKHSGEAADRAAKAAKTNRQYISNLKKLEEEAPELYAKLKARKLAAVRSAIP